MNLQGKLKQFTRKSAACTVQIASFSQYPQGVLIVVQSEEISGAAYRDCCNLLEEVVGAIRSLLLPSTSRVGVVSSCDLKKNVPEPHIYSEDDVGLFLKQGLLNFLHPQHGAEFLNSLLVQSLAPSECCVSRRNLLEECVQNAQVCCT